MITIVDFESKYASAFKELNEAWITKFFKLEEEDLKSLNHPEKIIESGGFILVALFEETPVGVCALKKLSSEKFELSKFAVDETKQGLGIGKALMDAVIAKAKMLNIKALYLEGNTKLGSSIHLYKKYGFKEMNLADYASAYERVNIVMELQFY